LCFEPPRRFIHNELGWNFRLSNIQAALGLAQLEQIEQSIEKKRYIGKRYTELLQDIPVLQLPIPEMHYAKNIYWVYGIVINDDTGITADEIINQLGDNNIGSRPFFWPMHKQPVLNSMGLFIDESYPVAERLAEQGFYIPSGMAITDQQIESVAEVLHNLFL
jgi:perosamine synthetase